MREHAGKPILGHSGQLLGNAREQSRALRLSRHRRRPQLTIAPDGSGDYLIEVDGTPNLTYRLQRAHSLIGPWTTSAPQTAPSSGLIEFHDLFPPPDRAFYRAVEQ